MNNTGQIMLFGLMLMIFIFILAVAMIGPMQEMIRDFRADYHCSWTNLSINDRALCTLVDLYLPYFIITVLIGSAAYLFYRAAVVG